MRIIKDPVVAAVLAAVAITAGLLIATPFRQTIATGFECAAGEPLWIQGKVYCLQPARKERP